MILIHGKILPNTEQGRIIASLNDDLLSTLSSPNPLTSEMVIAACDTLGKRVLGGEYDDVVVPLLNLAHISKERFISYGHMFLREGLEKKMRTELGEDYPSLTPLDENNARCRCPLGVLLHIAAGNVDGLPAYSVIEGLLVGNINLLKLPTGDSGLSIRLLGELIKTEPRLADYIYVFDVPSTEIETLRQLAVLSDVVVVWGGDAANKAAREMADITTKIVSWGHKLSFAYATKDATDEDLRGLAKSIVESEQILCSSCQGIYVDTDKKEEQLAFASRFYQALRAASAEEGKAPLGMRAKNAINIYNEKLEASVSGRTVFAGEGVSVIVSDDEKLELSYLFRSVWVKRLPHERLVRALHGNKNHLQTAGLACSPSQRSFLSGLLAAAGVTRVTLPGEMSRIIVGEAHDGVYPLREYSRLVEIAK
jgi:hypothetical protein